MGNFLVLLFCCSATFIIGFFVGCIFYMTNQKEVLLNAIKKMLIKYALTGETIQIDSKEYGIVEILK